MNTLQNRAKSEALIQWVNKHLELILTTEKYAISILAPMFLLTLAGIPYLGILLVMSAIVLGIVYFLLSFYTHYADEMKDFVAYNELGSLAFTMFMKKLYYLGLSITAFSMIYLVTGAPITFIFPVLGGMTLGIVFGLSKWAQNNYKATLYNKLFHLRIYVAIIFLILLILGLL